MSKPNILNPMGDKAIASQAAFTRTSLVAKQAEFERLASHIESLTDQIFKQARRGNRPKVQRLACLLGSTIGHAELLASEIAAATFEPVRLIKAGDAANG